MVCENSDALGDCPLEQMQLKSKVSYCCWVTIRLDFGSVEHYGTILTMSQVLESVSVPSGYCRQRSGHWVICASHHCSERT